MADRKISELTAQTNAALDGADLFVLTDTSETETKSMSVTEIDKRYSKARTELPTPYTPTVFASSTTFTDIAGRWRLDGNYMKISVSFGVNTPGGSANLTVSIPAGYTIDTTYIFQTSPVTAADMLGGGKWFDNGSAYRFAMAHYETATTVCFAYAEGGQLINAGILANGDRFSLNIEVPVVELATNVDA